jgi:Zn-dependent peptidase ImmA (M78 family)
MKGPPDEEAEANAFAMELLMPEQFVKDYLDKHGPIDLMDSKALGKMAKTFGVDLQVMAIRLGQLYPTLKRKSS